MTITLWQKIVSWVKGQGSEGEVTMPGRPKGKKRKPAPPPTPAPTTVKVHADATTIYADGSGFAPNFGHVTFDMRSHAEGTNPSTQGVTYSGYTGSDADGNAHFHGPLDYMVPDVPRHVTCTMSDGTNSATGEMDF